MPLNSESRLRVIAPSCPPTEDRLRAGVEALEALGFIVEVDESAMDVRDFSAADDHRRAQALHDALLAPEVDAVICARGGFGAGRLLPHLDINALAQVRKPFCGYSDITMLHLALGRTQTDLIWGPMVASNFDTPMPDHVLELSRLALLGELTGRDLLADIKGVESLVPGEVQAPVCGGTLCLLCSSLGTPWEVDCTGHILLLEDTDEDLYRIDRYLTQLGQAGKLASASGFILGRTFAKPHTGPQPWTIETIIEAHFRPLGKPTVWQVPTGHAEYCLPIPLGRLVRLQATSIPRLSVL